MWDCFLSPDEVPRRPNHLRMEAAELNASWKARRRLLQHVESLIRLAPCLQRDRELDVREGQFVIDSERVSQLRRRERFITMEEL